MGERLQKIDGLRKEFRPIEKGLLKGKKVKE